MIRSVNWRNTASRTALAVVLSLGGLAAPAVVQAATVTQDGAQTFNIPAGPLAQSLRRYTEITGQQTIYSSDLVADLRAPAVEGRYTPQQALGIILSGSGIGARQSGNTVALERAASAGVNADGDIELGTVRIEGSAGLVGATSVNGVNGSRDVTATEGTGSFTSNAVTVGSKQTRSLQETPQSVSVVTAERLEQQNVTDFTRAMTQLPGITLEQGDTSLQTRFYSRGFQVQSIQIDGGAPLTTSLGFVPQIDFAQYDHVELLRGASGNVNGYGEPSGVVNLVRKRPLDRQQAIVEAQAGSWSNYRAVIDYSMPPALEGDLRGRLVGVYQQNEYFYDVADDSKVLLYGIAEYDLSPSTILSGGLSHSVQHATPWRGGLPRYLNGDDLDLSRSTALAFPWSRWDFETTEYFAALEHDFSSRWEAKASLTYNIQDSFQKLGFSYGAVSPETGVGPFMAVQTEDYGNKQLALDVSVSGAFDLFGREQFVTFGANIADSRADVLGYRPFDNFQQPYQPYAGGPVYCQDYGLGGCPPGSIAFPGPPINVFAFDPEDPLYGEPATSLRNQNTSLRQRQSGAFVTARLSPLERWYIDLSMRYSGIETRTRQDSICAYTLYECDGLNIGDISSTIDQRFSDDDIVWPPSLSVTYRWSDAISTYVGYTDIYKSQTDTVDRDLEPISPITGSNYEAGVRFTGRDGRLNASAAVYQIDQSGFAIFDPASYLRLPDGSIDTSVSVDNLGNEYFYGQGVDGLRCCFVAGDVSKRSQGFDLEVNGEVVEGLQLSASYTYNDNEYSGSDLDQVYGDVGGRSFITISPAHTYKLWVSYAFDSVSPVSGVTASVGINGQSDAYRSGSICTAFFPPDPQGATACSAFAPYSFTFPSYSVVSSRIDYNFSENLSIAVNFNNIFDERYYQTAGGDTAGGNWYGEPRSATISLKTRF